MKQVDKLKESLEAKMGLDINFFIELYQEGTRLEDIVRIMESTPWKIKLIGSTLNLRFARKYREHDLNYLSIRNQDNADETLLMKIEELTSNLDQLSDDFTTQNRALVRSRNQTNILRRGVREEAATDSVYDFISKVVESVTPIPTPEVTDIEARRYPISDIKFMVLSDIHAEEVVDSSQVPTGEYSWDIMTKRVKTVFYEVLGNQKGWQTLDIYILGDLISGFIHGSDVNTSKHPILALTGLAELLASEIARVARDYPEVRVYTTTGNHDRLGNNPSIINKSYDFSFLLYKLMESHLSNQANVSIEISGTGLCVVPIGSERETYIGLSHGDQVSGGSLKTIEFFRATMGVDVHHLVQGHYHVPKIEALGARGFCITNGSVIGPGSYSHVKGFIPTPWSQTVGVWGSDGEMKEITLVTKESELD